MNDQKNKKSANEMNQKKHAMLYLNFDYNLKLWSSTIVVHLYKAEKKTVSTLHVNSAVGIGNFNFANSLIVL